LGVFEELDHDDSLRFDFRKQSDKTRLINIFKTLTKHYNIQMTTVYYVSVDL